MNISRDIKKAKGKAKLKSHVFKSQGLVFTMNSAEHLLMNMKMVYAFGVENMTQMFLTTVLVMVISGTIPTQNLLLKMWKSLKITF